MNDYDQCWEEDGMVVVRACEVVVDADGTALQLIHAEEVPDEVALREEFRRLTEEFRRLTEEQEELLRQDR